MPVIIKNGKVYGDRNITLTQAEYDALPVAEKCNGTVYYITDSTTSYPTASNLRYDTGHSVKDKIDELGEGLNNAMSLNLLWRDENPPSSTGAFNISCDCSGYSLFMLVSHNYELAGQSAFLIFKGDTFNTYYVTSSGTSNYNTKSRTVTITDSGVTVAAGYQGNNTSDNRVLVPYELYGVL